MSSPTPEQRAILDDPARIRVVRAVPGSGKTWLVAELIRREIATWITKGSGIAALSFTRVGGDEIRQAVGHELAHPHFVGTLDAFLFRYIVRPFLRLVYPVIPRVRLIPADWSPERWTKPPKEVSFEVRPARGSKARPINIFETCFVGEEDGHCIVAHRPPFGAPLVSLPPTIAAQVLNAKKRVWKRLGWLTHSDVALLASELLEHVEVGAAIRTEIGRRFPLIIVDELQDTGWFLGKAIETILADDSVRGFLVGDPDQAIYEFNGARPDLFDRFSRIPDAIELPLGRSLRCSAIVCRVAEALAQSRRRIEEAESRQGRAILLPYNDLSTDIARLRNHLAQHGTSREIKLIARHNSTIESVTGRRSRENPALGSAPLNHLQRAVEQYRIARQARALASARAALELVAFQQEGVDDEELIRQGIDPVEWKRLAIECLFAANTEVIGETLFDWGVRIASTVQDLIQSFVQRSAASVHPHKIRSPAKTHQKAQRDAFLFKPTPESRTAREVPVQTVHSVKGETHDLTVFVCPPQRADRCPSHVWWSDTPQDLEERRIAFVAITRTRGDLLLCVSNETFTRLRQRHSEFVNLFEVMSIPEFISSPFDHASPC